MLLTFYVDNNTLTGKIPTELGNMKLTTDMGLSFNQLTGPIPNELGNLNVRALQLNNNLLTGKIPKELGNCSELEVLVLVQNRLTGSIPKELGSLKRLQVFTAGSNKLSGNLTYIFSAEKQTNLQTFDVSENFITGPIPSSIFQIPNITTISLASNCFSSGELPPSICTSAATLILDGLHSSQGCLK